VYREKPPWTGPETTPRLAPWRWGSYTPFGEFLFLRSRRPRLDKGTPAFNDDPAHLGMGLSEEENIAVELSSGPSALRELQL
jgi:hypothetical protein